MEFTWKQFIELIEKTFEIKKSALAPYLAVSKSTISRLCSGKTQRFTTTNKAIYENIFNPANRKSLAYSRYANTPSKEIEETLLSTIKQIIDAEKYFDSFPKITANEYKDYIYELIKLAKESSAKEKAITLENIPQANISSNSTEHMSLGNSPAITGDGKVSIPVQCQKCVYCVYYHIAEPVHKNISNPLGTCTVHEKKTKSASPSCEYFEANIGKFITRMLTHDFS
ncbi:MAG: hypothetical protein K2K90_02135 [Lachnospiraceae bacterium]|nr:hypothetical protein [Lachnospiraceae bacterium]